MKILVFIIALSVTALAQQEPERTGVHQIDAELHAADPVPSTPPSTQLPLRTLRTATPTALSKKVVGWHPYWAASSAYLNYDYAALTHIAYFSYETDTATGGYKTVRGWESTSLINYAHSFGTKVLLTVTNFGTASNTALLSDTGKQGTMITQLISLLNLRGGDGVNFDLESVPLAQRSNLVAFMQKAATRIRSAIPGAEISMAAPAVDWSGSWDLAQLGQICDYLIVMGYDYYWSGSTTAGPVAPLEGENYNITRSIDTYLAASVPAAKLYLGMPWYGYDWPVQSNARKSTATGTASSRTYTVALPMAAQYGVTFDVTTKTSWVAYQSGIAWRQLWFDDTTGYNYKYGLVKSRNLGGIGIWALSYDGGRPEIWSGIKRAFYMTKMTEDPQVVPDRIDVIGNFPNPFNPETHVFWNLGSPGRVKITVVDALGREIAMLADEDQAAGPHTAIWNAARFPSGLYYSVMTTNRGRTVNKMLVVR